MPGLALPPRLILLHKQSTSGRVRFYCARLTADVPDAAEAATPTVLVFEPLPALAELRNADDTPPAHMHPAGFLRDAENRLGLPVDGLVAETEFSAWVDTPEGDIPVLLARFASMDPPFELAARHGAGFIAMTEARRLPVIERELLRRAYETVLGG